MAPAPESKVRHVHVVPHIKEEPQSEPVLSAPPVPTLEERLAEKELLLKMYEEENRKLQEQREAAMQQVHQHRVRHESEKTDLISRLKMQDDLIKTLERQVETHQVKEKAADKAAADFHKASMAQEARAKRLLEEIETLTNAPASIVGPIDKALGHVIGLWKSGLFSAGDVMSMLDKMVEKKP
jgi:DNA primase